MTETVLAVDTTSDRLDMSLLANGRLWRRRAPAAGRQDEKLADVLEHLLKKARVRPQELDLLAAAAGPGSFTGIRVGMTFVSILAQSLGKPAAAVTLLEAQASRVEAEDASLLGIVLPALRDEFFFQVYGRDRPASGRDGAARGNESGAAWIAKRPPRWLRPQDWPAALREDAGHREILLTGAAARDAARHLPSKQAARARVIPSPAPSSEDLLSPALARLRSGELGEFSPLYLRPPYYDRNR